MTIRERADALLRQTALMHAVAPCRAEIVGSYAMDLMSWNDLDLYVVSDGMTAETWTALTARVIAALQPSRIDGFQDAAQGRYFLGIETEISGERWNVDIWGRTTAEIADAQAKNRAMQARFAADAEARAAMLSIKRELIARKMYGFDKGAKHFHSPEIYDAVLEKGVRRAEDLLREK